MRVLLEEPRCPGCGKPMELMFEHTPRPRIQCMNIECAGKGILFPYHEGPLITAKEVVDQWREFRKAP